ncbi:hypothetical protein AVT06_00010 [Pseudomonas aeruginosa]|nr:hypothetical protein AVT06_00010 [Pseudomonas aeruginosa]
MGHSVYQRRGLTGSWARNHVDELFWGLSRKTLGIARGMCGSRRNWRDIREQQRVSQLLPYDF